VNGEKIAARQKLSQLRHALDTELGGLVWSHERIVADHVHVEPGSSAGDFPADAAQSHHAECLAGELRADELVALPLALVQAGIGRRNVACQGHEEGYGVFGRADRIAARCVHDHDADPGRGRHVDVVDADAGADDRPQPAGLRQKIGRQPCAAADNDAVGGPKSFLQGRAHQPRPIIELDARLAEKFQPRSFELVADQDAWHLHFLVSGEW